jgi:hypothetical protein
MLNTAWDVQGYIQGQLFPAPAAVVAGANVPRISRANVMTKEMAISFCLQAKSAASGLEAPRATSSSWQQFLQYLLSLLAQLLASEIEAGT